MRQLLFSAFLIIACALVVACNPNTGATPTTHEANIPKEMVLTLNEKTTLKLVLIPSGKFLMGSPETEKGRDKNEAQHEITIGKPFYMGITHVTVDQFAVFVMDSAYKTDAEKEGQSYGYEIVADKVTGFIPPMKEHSWHNLTFKQKGDHPVIQISWNDAQAFCVWLSRKSGKTVMLPTEAQWEYACRARTTTAYPWGDNPDDGKGWANCGDQSLQDKLPLGFGSSLNFFSYNDSFPFTSPVASFKPNAFGLYDMIGNAMQWCKDYYTESDKAGYTTHPGDHVLRGSSWFSFPDKSRTAYRGPGAPNFRGDIYGFRVAMEIP